MAPSPGLELGLTILVEAPIVWAFAGRLNLDRGRALLACCLVNLATQPLLVLALHRVNAAAGPPWWTAFTLGELAVWVAEAGLYLLCLKALRRTRRPILTALSISLAANAASAALGLLLPI